MGELRLPIPDELHISLKKKALDKGISLKQLIINILQGYTVQDKSEANEVIKEG